MSARPGRLPLVPSLLCVLWGTLALLLLHTEGPFIRGDWLLCLAWLMPSLALVILLWRRSGGERRVGLAAHAPLLILAGLTFLFLFSSASQHRWALFVRWPRGQADPMRMDLGRFIRWTSVLIPLFAMRVRRVWILLLAVLVLSQVACLGGLISGTAGRALYGDDHPSMMFRLWEFRRTFPQLVNYNPYWNAGTVHFAGVNSGIHGPGLLLWPLWRFMAIHDVYTFCVGLLYIVVLPLVAAGSVRALRGDRTAAIVAACLALGVSHHFFLWGLFYGTIGAVPSSFMIVPLAALTYGTLHDGRMSMWRAIALTGSVFWLLLWPPGAILGAVVALACLLGVRAWTWRRIGFLAACVGIALVLYLPWLRVVSGEGKTLVNFVVKPDAVAASGGAWNREALLSGWRYLVAHVREGHPLLIFFGLLGLVAVRDRTMAGWFGAIYLALALIAGWSRLWLPNAQLWRMAIPLFAVSVLPASLLLARVLQLDDLRVAGVRAGLAALLALGGANAARIYSNHGRFQYAVLDERVREFADWLAGNVPEDARVLFAGPTVHAFFKGHVAYLPVLARREMMASDYYAFPPQSTEYRYPPRAYRETFEGLRGFLDAYNVTHVVTCHDSWRDRLREYDFYFKEVVSFDYLTVFEAARSSRPLLIGQGQVRTDFNRIRVSLDKPFTEAVLCYNWVEGLRAQPPAECFPYHTDNGLVLIGLRPHGAGSITIRYRP